MGSRVSSVGFSRASASNSGLESCAFVVQICGYVSLDYVHLTSSGSLIMLYICLSMYSTIPYACCSVSECYVNIQSAHLVIMCFCSVGLRSFNACVEAPQSCSWFI